jgi:hypothetical protein
MQPKSKLAKKSATGIAEALAFRAKSREKSGNFDQSEKDYTSLQQSAKTFYDQKGLGSKKFKDEMYDYYQIATAKMVEVKFKGSKKNRCG